MKNARSLGLTFTELVGLPAHWIESAVGAPAPMEPAKQGAPAPSRPATLYEVDKLREFKAQFAPRGT